LSTTRFANRVPEYDGIITGWALALPAFKKLQVQQVLGYASDIVATMCVKRGPPGHLPGAAFFVAERT
jgi:hypothetical protein